MPISGYTFLVCSFQSLIGGPCWSAVSLSAFLADVGEKPITMNSLAVQAGVSTTTITRLARNDQKETSTLSLDLASRIVTVLDCGIEDLLEVVEG
jgi:DNA-binding Xre family transcriptional regulator